MGQNQIGARDKQSAIEWIKILKTSLILVNQDDGSLKNELDEINDNPYADEEHDNISNSLGNFFD